MADTLTTPVSGDARADETTDRSPRRTAIAVGALAAVLAFAGSWIPSLWGDEVTSVMSADRSWASLARMLGHIDAVHGTYYAALHLWVDVFGASPVSVRAPSAIGVGVAAAGLVVLVRALGGTARLALLAGVVVAVLPRMTYAGEEARSYAWTAAVATWTLVAAVHAARSKRGTRDWVVVGALTTAGAYLFLESLLAVPVVGLAVLLVGGRRRLVPWAATSAVAVVAAAPIIVAGYLQRGQIAFLSDRVTTDPGSLLVGMWFSSAPMAVAAWACIALALTVGIRALVRRERVPRLLVLALVWAALPPTVLVAALPVMHAFSARYMTFAAPGAALLVAIGIDALRRPGVRALAVVAVLAAAATAYAPQRTPYAKNGSDWAEVASVVAAGAHPGDQVAFDETTRPSRAPRLSMHGYPSAFRGLGDPGLVTSFRDATTWHDTARSVPETVAAGGFTATTVWFVGADSDPSGSAASLAALHGAGYREVRAVHLHTDLVVELRR
jgi:mannosyltransferase